MQVRFPAMKVVLPLSVLAVSLLLLAAPAVAAAPLVVIDPGHGGRYSNANANGLREKNVNLAISLELRRQLVARGYRVAMTRTTDRAITYADVRTWNWSSYSARWSYAFDAKRGIYQGVPKDDLQARVDIANRLGADLFISIHNNGSASRSARGTETYAASQDALGRQLAPIVHRRILARTGLRNRGVGTVDFYVCRWANMPAILVEGAFISNPRDAALLKSYSFRRKMAVGIAEGVHTWFRSRPFKPAARKVSTSSAYSAAVGVSKLRFPDGAPAVVVARGDHWSAHPGVPALARRLGASLLWVPAAGLASEQASELARLAPERLVIVGVSGSFDETAVARLTEASSVPTSAVDILAAPTRASLAVSVASSMGPAPSGEVFIVHERDSWSMLALAPIAAARRIPVLMSSSGTLTAETAAYLKDNSGWIRSAVLVGSASRVPSTVARGVPSARRYAGDDVPARALALNNGFYRSSATNSLSPVVADYSAGAEYLTAAFYAAPTSRPVVPVSAGLLPSYSRLWIVNKRPQIGGFEVFDAKRSIPAKMEYQLRKADR